MTDVSVFGDLKTMATNPWLGTKYGKSSYYLRDPIPWDNRRQGTGALSTSQRQVTAAFTSAAKGASRECPKTGRMKTNICRVEYIKNQLKGKTYGGGLPGGT